MYKYITGKNAYFLGNAEDMYLWGTLSTIGTLLLFYFFGRLCRDNFLIIFFGRYQTFGFCLTQFIEPRISNTAFLFFTEVQASGSVALR